MTEQSGTGQVAYRRSGVETADKWLFVIVAVLGAGGILWTRESGYGPFQVVAVPVALLVLYAISIIALRRFRLRDDRSADNCYYLGFLFTLVSLAHALYRFQIEGKGTADLIQDFGVALASTIAGIALRLVLNQLREDPVEIEREGRHELSEAVRRVRVELDQMVVDFNSYRRSLTQSIQEAMQEASATANESVTSNAERFEEVAKAMIEKVDGAFSAHSKVAEKLALASGRTVEVLERMIERIDNIEVPEDFITGRLQPAVNEISAAAQAVNRRANAESKQAQRLGDLIEKAVASAQLLDERLERTMSHDTGMQSITAKLNDAVTKLEQAVTPFGTGVRDISESMVTLTTASESSVKAIRHHSQELERELEKSRNITLRVHGELVGLADLISEKLGDRKDSGSPSGTR
jgi:hypothetical protein